MDALPGQAAGNLQARGLRAAPLGQGPECLQGSLRGLSHLQEPLFVETGGAGPGVRPRSEGRGSR
eukprot:8055995-Alexandrium_andersonii.AAC.1